MTEGEELHLHWKDASSNVVNSLREMRQQDELQDVTLICSDGQTKAHKVVLASGSWFFKEVFNSNPHQHPLLYLFGVNFEELNKILDFLYFGEVKIRKDNLDKFLVVASDLRIKGLAEDDDSGQDPKLEKKNIDTSASLKRKADNGSQTLSGNLKRNKVGNDETLNYPEIKMENLEHQTQTRGSQYLRENFSETECIVDGDPLTARPEDPMTGFDLEAASPLSSKTDTPHMNGYVIREDSSCSENAQVRELLEQQISEKMTRDPTTNTWLCILCGYNSGKHRGHMVEHQESAHIQNLTYECGNCGSVFKGRKPLRRHKTKCLGRIKIEDQEDLVEPITYSDDFGQISSN